MSAATEEQPAPPPVKRTRRFLNGVEDWLWMTTWAGLSEEDALVRLGISRDQMNKIKRYLRDENPGMIAEVDAWYGDDGERIG